VLALLVLYPLSVGPAHRFASWSRSDVPSRTFNVVYAPLYWLCEQSETSEGAIYWYVNSCDTGRFYSEDADESE
jgi:hypothetical protein